MRSNRSSDSSGVTLRRYSSSETRSPRLDSTAPRATALVILGWYGSAPVTGGRRGALLLLAFGVFRAIGRLGFRERIRLLAVLVASAAWTSTNQTFDLVR